MAVGGRGVCVEVAVAVKVWVGSGLVLTVDGDGCQLVKWAVSRMIAPARITKKMSQPTEFLGCRPRIKKTTLMMNAATTRRRRDNCNTCSQPGSPSMKR